MVFDPSYCRHPRRCKSGPDVDNVIYAGSPAPAKSAILKCQDCGATLRSSNKSGICDPCLKKRRTEFLAKYEDSVDE